MLTQFVCVCVCVCVHVHVHTHTRGKHSTLVLLLPGVLMYEVWNFNFGNTLLDWIQELLE